MRAVLLLVCGCNSLIGVHDFAASDAGVDAVDPHDAAPPPGCLPRWQDRTVHFTTPVPLDLGVPGAIDRDPAVSPDGSLLFFSSDRGGNLDIYTWPTDGSAAPTLATAFDTPADETKVSVRSDGLQVVIARSSNGNADLWTASRGSPTEPYGTFKQLDNIDIGLAVYDPELVGAGLVLYFSRGDNDGQHVYRASRTGLAAPFTNLTRPITEVAADPWASPDETLLVYSHAPSAQMSDLYYQTPTFAGPVPELDTMSAEGDPSLTADACTIYFASNRDTPQLQLFRAAVSTD